MHWVLYMIIGTFTGILTGILGGGSGPVLIPIITALLVYQGVAIEQLMQLAVGTVLGIGTLAMLASVHVHRKHLEVLKHMVILLLPGGIIGAGIGVVLAGFLPNQLFKIGFVFVMIGMASYTLIEHCFSKNIVNFPSKRKVFFLSIPMGIIATCFGVGMGPVCVPLMKRYGFSFSQSIAIAVFVGVIIVVFAAVGFMLLGYHNAYLPPYSLGYMYLPMVAGIGVPSILFARVGAKLAHSLPERVVKRMFAFFLFMLAFKMMV